MVESLYIAILHGKMVLSIVICGLFGGLATVCGKLCFTHKNAVWNMITSFCNSPPLSLSVEMSDYAIVIGRLLALGGIILSNACNVGYFLKAMRENNTVIVVVISSAVNFLISGLLGQLLFAEVVSSSWFAGSALIVMGMVLVSMSEGPQASSTPTRK